MTVNVTTLLVLTTLFIGISNSLPKTAYIKVVDVWLIINLLIPFLEVLLHTVIDMLRNGLSRKEEPEMLFVRSVDGSPRMLEQVKKGATNTQAMVLNSCIIFGRVGLPALYTLFCIVIFVYGRGG